MSQIEIILEELGNVPNPFDDQQVFNIISLIHQSKHIYLSGAGRSGLMIRAFANRLVQLGKSVSVVGEISAPRTQPNDLIIFSSASGQSSNLVSQAKSAQSFGLKSLLFTTAPSAPLSQYVDTVVQVQAQSKYSETVSSQPMGALYEQYSLLLFDSIVLEYMKAFDINEETMRNNHAVIE